MELNERETLVRVEQQLKDSVNNQSKIMSDLKEIFGRIETDSKLVVTLNGDLKYYLENSRFRWDELEKKIKEILEKLNRNENQTDENTRILITYSSIQKTIEECKESINTNRKSISEEKDSRSLFQQDITSTIKTIGWLFGGLATLAAIISGAVLILQVFMK